jgi:membrane protein
MTFSWYVQNYGTYNRTYGDLGAAVGFLTWIWISIVILLTGAEITCECEKAAKGSAAPFSPPDMEEQTRRHVR